MSARSSLDVGSARAGRSSRNTNDVIIVPGVHQLPRQVAFGGVGHSRGAGGFRNEANSSVTGGQQQQRLAGPRNEGSQICYCLRRYFDSTTICYVTIALLMISVGIVITAVTARDAIFRYQKDFQVANSSPQLWIVGPIFVCSGFLVIIKAGSHIYRMAHPRPLPSRGEFLTADSRPSLAGLSFPPSYSVALAAPLHSVTVDDDDKLLETRSFVENDSDSLQLVTLDFDPPPSYTEALNLIEQKRQGRSARDVGVQSDDVSSTFPGSALALRAAGPESRHLSQSHRSRSHCSLPSLGSIVGRKSRSLDKFRPQPST